MGISNFQSSLRMAITCLITGFCMISASCDNLPTGGGSGTLNVGLSSGGQALAHPSLADAANSVTVTSAKFIIGRISFKSVDGSDSVDFRSNSPMIVDLNLEGTIQEIGSISINPGVYDETRFRIEDLDDGDSAIYADNPDMQDLSIRVEGYVNGTPDSSYVWTADFMEDQVHQFTPFTINAGDTVSLLFEFDHTLWFVDEEGVAIDPRDALVTGVQSDIEANVKSAFKVIRR